MKSLRYIAFAAALLASGSAAQAKMDVVLQSGAWRASTGLNTEGNPMCSMSTFGDNGRSAYIKWQANSGTKLFVQLFKTSWNIPDGVDMPLEIKFDHKMPLAGIAKKLTTKNVNNKAIEVSVKSRDSGDSVDEMMNFLKLFVTSSSMSIKFTGGTEPNWRIKMDGAETIGQRFTKCVIDSEQAYKAGGGGTQPFGNNGMQPLDTKPKSDI